MKKGFLTAVIAAGMMAVALTGCGSKKTTNNDNGTTGDSAAKGTTASSQASADLSGTISLAGSTSMEKLC